MQNITGIEILEIVLYLGSITYIVGIIAFVILLRKLKFNAIAVSICCIIKQICSLFLSLLFWLLFFNRNDMIFFIFLPSLFAEILLIPLFYFFLKRIRKGK